LGASGAQEQCAQVLLHGARADVQAAGNFFVAASLREQAENLLIAGSYFDGVQIDRWRSLPPELG
jgi:hypothetical protein